MDASAEIIRLSGGDCHVTDNAGSNYRVLSGTVSIFVTRMESGENKRLVFLCDIEEGGMFPGFHYVDSLHQEWQFVVKPAGDAELERGDYVTSILKKKFIARTRISNYAQEGFENSLVEYYLTEEVKDNVFISRIRIIEDEGGQRSFSAIAEGMENDPISVVGENPLYRVVAYACKAASIEVADEREVVSACGSVFTVQDIVRVSRFACRDVVLEPDWYKKDCGTFISYIEGQPVACIPRGQNRYHIYYGDGKPAKLTAAIAETVEPRAVSLVRTLPNRRLSGRDILKFCLRSLNAADIALISILGLASGLLGILLPTLNQKIYDDYIPLGNMGQLAQICAIIATLMIGTLFFDMVKRLSDFRIGARVGYDLQNAVYSRVFHLPENFFRDYDSADLAQRIMAVSSYAREYTTATLITGIGTVFSMLYLYRMFKYAKKLAWLALVMILLYSAVIYYINSRTIRHEKKLGELKGEASSKLYQFLSGIEKIRLAGVEDRAAYEYIIPFAEKQSMEIKKNYYTESVTMLSGSVSFIFSIFFYWIVVKNKLDLSTGSFMAFNSAFGSFSGAIFALVNGLLSLIALRPTYDRFSPVLTTAPEDSSDNESPGELQGGITLSDVRFAYSPNSPLVLNGINMEIKKGEYIGIVGGSGCGKSTLLKLLLGFESPLDGSVMYDGKDIRSLDKRELRKQLGVVLQNGKLISGSIYENITITAPKATMKDVQAVVEAVGLKEDIAQMPMGLHTVLSENSGTISGGQQQRILIARAIISKPSILIFDEATSALDNVTQAKVTESLDKMNATRIVVAHRLSTIRKCDRIYVLKNGRVHEQGSYRELMALHGEFYELASRQLVDGQ